MTGSAFAGSKGMKTIRRKGSWVILGLALAAAAVLLAAHAANRNKTALRSLTVYVGGKEYLSSPLVPGERIVIAQEDGRENVIRMTENGFYMESASCPNHDCVAQGEVNTENWRHRKLLEQVICLPNRVTVSLDIMQNGEKTEPDTPDI